MCNHDIYEHPKVGKVIIHSSFCDYCQQVHDCLPIRQIHEDSLSRKIEAQRAEIDDLKQMVEFWKTYAPVPVAGWHVMKDQKPMKA